MVNLHRLQVAEVSNPSRQGPGYALAGQSSDEFNIYYELVFNLFLLQGLITIKQAPSLGNKQLTKQKHSHSKCM